MGLVGDDGERCSERGVVCAGALGEDGAATAAQVDESLVAQVLVGVQHGVDVEAEGVGQVARGREPFSGLKVGSGGCQPHLARELGEEGLGGCGVDSEEHSLTIVVLVQCAQAGSVHQ